jgi:hydroxymethylpyrimidine pyrophosphatase-like HAD family hydrolase
VNRPVPLNTPPGTPAPRPRPRLVACDLDGTLLRRDHTLSGRTRAALYRLDALGVPFVVVTGRSIGAWIPTARRLSLTTPAVCANGAMVVDGRGSILAHRPMSPAALSVALTGLRRSVPGAVAGVERGGELLHEAGFPRPTGALTRPTRVVDAHELVAHPASKLLVRSVSRPTVGWRVSVAEAIGRRLAVVDSGVPDLVEAVAAGVSKATGLAWLATRLGVDQADVVAYGDMPNDVPMLRWAGQGIAVADGHPAALTAADASTGPCTDDGVAAHLERLFA